MYAAFYNFRDLPFQLGPDPRFFYGSSGHSKAMAYLTYGLNQGEGFIIVTGEVGAGKTTLIGQLFSGLDKDRHLAATLVTTQLKAEALLRSIAGAFGLDVEAADKATLLKRIEAFLLAAHREGKRVLLIVDEVQNLPLGGLEELRMLSNFQVGPQPLLQTFLLGQPQFRRTLASPDLEQLRQRVIASYHLGPLTRDETGAYIQHRLERVGWRDDPSWTPAAFGAIHRRTGGIPRRVNTLCSRLLLYGYLEEAHEIDAAVVEQVAEELEQELPQADRIAPAPGNRPLGNTYALEDLDDRLDELETRVRDEDRKERAADPSFGSVNALSIDVEDWFQVEALSSRIDRADWPRCESRVERNTERLLQLLDERNLHATFFVLGWIAERHRGLVQRIVAHGHELACHGYAHSNADQQTPRTFRADVGRAKKLLEDIGGVPVRGYRAPCFSIGPANIWALEELAELGFAYDSSIYPIRHDLYGMPEAPRFAHRPRGRDGVLEVPIATVRRFGRNLPCGGGGYFRHLPYWLNRRRLRRLNRKDRQPAVFYIHPWEIDPGQPRQRGLPMKARFRHYRNLEKTEARLCRLLRDFRWDRLDRIFQTALSAP